MSRTRKAALSAGFAYAQFLLGAVGGLITIRATLGQVGPRNYGLWLTSGELVGYVGLLDIGVFALLPWLVAEADGRGDRQAIRGLIRHALWFGAAVGALYLAVVAACWQLLPGLLNLTPADEAALRWPLLVLVAVVGLTYPLRVFIAVVAGLQDVVFSGGLALVTVATQVTTTLVMLANGMGLMSLACGAAVGPLIGGVAALVRVAGIAPDLFHGWPPFSPVAFGRLALDGLGVWSGTIGTQLMAASAALIITAASRPEWVALYSCSSKLALIATQLAWILPDSGLVGLAQLRGHGDTGRVRDVVVRVMSLHLLISVTAAFGLLMVNPLFVHLWVGPAYFAGFGFNGAAAALIVMSSLGHGAITCAAVLGNRGRVGLTVLFQAVLHLAVSYALVRRFGVVGVVWSALGTGVIPLLQGLLLLRRQIQLDVRRLATQWLLPPAARVAPLLAAGWFVGALSTRVEMVWVIPMQLLAAAAFVGLMRPVLGWVWEDPRIRALMARFRLAKVEA